MNPEQKRYLSLLTKDRWNKMVTEIEMGDKPEIEHDSEFAMIQSLFDAGVLDEDAVYDSTQAT
jgi:hypothetical protein